MKLNDKVYDVLKWLALVFFDAVGVLYKSMSTIWGLPYGDEVLATCSAIALFIGAVIGVSTAQYNKDKNETGTLIELNNPENAQKIIEILNEDAKLK